MRPTPGWTQESCTTGCSNTLLIMKVKTPLVKSIILISLLCGPALIYIGITHGKHNILVLPIFGPKEASVTMVDGKERIDTVYHTVLPFSYTAHNGKTITERDVEDKIVVVEYFFAKCAGICPKMRTQLRKVYAQNEYYKDVIILSHTVDPENDNLEVLNEYAIGAGVTDERWLFLTGDKSTLYEHAKKSYFIGVLEGNQSAGEEAFLHSDQLVLIDKDQRIRGYFTGTDPMEIKRLIDEIKVLKAEELIPRKQKTS